MCASNIYCELKRNCPKYYSQKFMPQVDSQRGHTTENDLPDPKNIFLDLIKKQNYKVENFKTNEIYYYDTYQDAIKKIDDFIKDKSKRLNNQAKALL